jgi:hypothetical protein
MHSEIFTLFPAGNGEISSFLVPSTDEYIREDIGRAIIFKRYDTVPLH